MTLGIAAVCVVGRDDVSNLVARRQLGSLCFVQKSSLQTLRCKGDSKILSLTNKSKKIRTWLYCM